MWDEAGTGHDAEPGGLRGDEAPLASRLAALLDGEALAASALMVVDRDLEDFEQALGEQGIAVAAVGDVDGLAEFDDDSRDVVVYIARPEVDRVDAESLSQMRRVARRAVLVTSGGARSAELERFFAAQGDAVSALGPEAGILARKSAAAGEVDDDAAIGAVVVAQATALAAAVRHLDAVRRDNAELRARVERAEAEADELAAMVAESLRALAEEQREHAESRRRVESIRASRAWPLLIVSYKVMHALRAFRARLRRAPDASPRAGDGD